MAEELIYNIEFLGTDKSITAIQALDEGISGLTKEVSALQQKQKEGQALTEAETKQLIEQKAQLKSLQSDRQQQEKQLINLNKSLNSNTGSYNELTTAVNAAKARLKELPIDQTSEEFRKLQQFVSNGTNKLKDFDKQIGDNQRNVGNYPKSFNKATASIKDLEQEIVRLNEVASTLDINSEEFKLATTSANELQTTIFQATGKIDEFGNREPKNQTKKAFDDAADSAAGLVAGVQLVSLALGDEEIAEKATAAATKANAIATNFALLLKAKEAIIDTAALAIKRIKIFLFGEELAATTALNAQTVFYAIYQKAAAAATEIATAASTAFGVSVSVATGGLTVIIGLLAAAAATFISFGSKASTAQLDLSSATDETNKKLKEQQDKIDELSKTNASIKIELKTEGLEKDLANLNIEREKALKDYEEKANEVLGELYTKDYEKFLELNREKFTNLDNIETIYRNKEEKLRQKDNEEKQKAIDEEKKKAQELAEEATKQAQAEKDASDKINKYLDEGAARKQKEFDDQRTNDAIQAAAQVQNNNKKKDEEKSFYDLAQSLRVNDTDLYFQFLESEFSTFAEFEKAKRAEKAIADAEATKAANELAAAKQKLQQQYFEAEDQAFALASELAANYFQSQIDDIANKQSAESAAIDALSLSDEERGRRQKALQKKTAKEKYDVELKAFNTEKAFKVAQATIAGAVAIVNTLAMPILGEALAIAIGITTALEIGTILAAKPPAPPAFASGGLITGAGSGTSDSVPILASYGESIMTARTTSMFAPLLSDLNVLGGGRAFATGGIVSPSSYSQLAESNQRGKAFEVINNRIDRMRVYQVESEVSNSQLRVGTLESEATW